MLLVLKKFKKTENVAVGVKESTCVCAMCCVVVHICLSRGPGMKHETRSIHDTWRKVHLYILHD